MNWMNAILPIIKVKFGKNYNPSDKYFIAIQGASSSGKTSFASKLAENLIKSGIKTFLLNLDEFYKTADNPGQEDPNYDFDNPEAIHWDVVFSLIKALNDGDDLLPVLRRRKDKNQKETIEYIKNTKPQVIIIEGIFAYNCINEFKLNCDELDARDTFKEIRTLFLRNEAYNKDLKVLKIFLPHCKDKFLAVRLARDLKVNKKKEEVISRFKTMIWPDTKKYVYSDNELNDITIVHGNFVSKEMNCVLENILKYFSAKVDVKTGKSKDDHSLDFERAKCTGECMENRNTMLLLSKDYKSVFNYEAIMRYLRGRQLEHTFMEYFVRNSFGNIIDLYFTPNDESEINY